MATMDHNEAVRLQAAEKYLLGELPKAQSDEYEEHYFDCPACAEDLKTTALFMESSRQVLREQALEPVDRKGFVPQKSGWFVWLRPTFAVPVFAALLLFIGYQNTLTIPALRQASSHASTAEVVKSFSIMSVGYRGEGSSALGISVGPHEDSGLDVDMPGNSSTRYLCQIQDESGKVLFTLPVSAEAAKRSVHVNIPAGSLQSGKYIFAIFIAQPSGGQMGNGSIAGEKPFTVEIIP